MKPPTRYLEFGGGVGTGSFGRSWSLECLEPTRRQAHRSFDRHFRRHPQQTINNKVSGAGGNNADRLWKRFASTVVTTMFGDVDENTAEGGGEIDFRLGEDPDRPNVDRKEVSD